MNSYFSSSIAAWREMHSAVSKAECIALGRNSIAVALSLCLVSGIVVSAINHKFNLLHRHISYLEFLINDSIQASDSDSDDIGGETCRSQALERIIDATKQSTDMNCEELKALEESLDSEGASTDTLLALSRTAGIQDWVLRLQGDKVLLRKAFPWLSISEKI